MVDKVSADDWDLTAVVRSCSSVNNTTNHPQKLKTTTNNTAVETSGGAASENPLLFLSTLKFEENEDPFFYPDLLMETNNGFDELKDTFKQFLNNDNPSSLTSLQGQQHQQQQQPPPPLTTMTTTAVAAAPATSTTSSSIFVFGDPENENQHHSVHQQQPQPHRQQQVAPDHSCLHPLRQLQSRSRKRKKTPPKTVCQVTEENLSADLWAWRKYGQKPIKGSQYPRNYYRCSSSKGCAARKQVDRSTTDPNIFIVSYTGEHTHPRPAHRNSLAGISRNKFPRAQDPVANVASPTHLSVTMPAEVALPPALAEEKKPGAGAADGEDDEDDLLIPNLSAAMNEDPFSGLDGFHAHNPAFFGRG